MTTSVPHPIVSARALDDSSRVFRDRAHAGRILAALVSDAMSTGAIVLGIAPGGPAVAEEIARHVGAPQEVIAVEPIRIADDTIIGAVAFDGTMRLNHVLSDIGGSLRHDIDEAVSVAMHAVAGRIEALRGDRALPRLSGRTAVVVDDGLSAPIVVRVALQAVRTAGAARVVLALPAGRFDHIKRLARQADETYCASLHYRTMFGARRAYARPRRRR